MAMVRTVRLFGESLISIAEKNLIKQDLAG
jgi:hypothetical protein